MKVWDGRIEEHQTRRKQEATASANLPQVNLFPSSSNHFQPTTSPHFPSLYHTPHSQSEMGVQPLNHTIAPSLHSSSQPLFDDNTSPDVAALFSLSDDHLDFGGLNETFGMGLDYSTAPFYDLSLFEGPTKAGTSGWAIN